jgi:hypothetical protein
MRSYGRRDVSLSAMETTVIIRWARPTARRQTQPARESSSFCAASRCVAPGRLQQSTRREAVDVEKSVSGYISFHLAPWPAWRLMAVGASRQSEVEDQHAIPSVLVEFFKAGVGAAMLLSAAHVQQPCMHTA